MKITITDDRMFVEHQSGVVNAYNHTQLVQQRDNMQQDVDRVQKDIVDIEVIIDRIKPIVKETFWAKVLTKLHIKRA